LRNLLKTIFERYNYEHDFKYDWNLFQKSDSDEKTEIDKTNLISKNVNNKVDIDIDNI
jgi:hypothetical protein